MKSFSCMPAVRTPEAPRDTCHLRIPGFCLPPEVTGSATPTDFDFGANTPFTFVPACRPPCLRFAVTVTGHHARLGTRLLAKLYRGGHPRPPNFMRFPRRNTPESRHSHGQMSRVLRNRCIAGAAGHHARLGTRLLAMRNNERHQWLIPCLSG